MNKNRILWATVGIVGFLGLLFVFSQNNGRSASAQVEISGDVVEAFIGDLSAGATATGQLLPREEAVLSVDAPGRVEAVFVRSGDTVQAGDPLVQLDTAVLEIAVQRAELSLEVAEIQLADLQTPAKAVDIASAEASVNNARARLDDLLDGPSAEEIAIADANLRVSEANLASSYADLGSAQDSITESQIEAARANLLNAEIQLNAAVERNEDNPTEETHQARLNAERVYANAKAQLDTLLAGPDVNAAASTVSSRDARLDASQIDYQNTLDGASEIDIANAQASLAQAEANLATLLEEPTAEEIASAQSEVEQAQISLENAQDSLAAAMVVAPFDGVITAVYTNLGEIGMGAVVEIVNTASLEAVIEVDEIDIGSFAEGQPATITLETWPDVEIESQIAFISPSSQRDNNALVTYDVYLELGESDLPLLIGMTANANLITTQREDVLLVPNAAITPDRQAGTYFVDVQLADGTSQEVEVTIGLRDGDFTEITSGLVEGDKLIIEPIGADEIDVDGPFG
ncbi:MAG: efflux RND transporter periplasmic adaptor subunit [Chloroflexota bacterium]